MEERGGDHSFDLFSMRRDGQSDDRDQASPATGGHGTRGGTTAVRECPSGLGHPSGCRPKYLVNSEGRSAIYSAAYEMNFEVWAWLMSEQFLCTEEEESDVTSISETNVIEISKAMDHYFAPVERCHVYSLLSRSTVIGGNWRGGGPGWEVTLRRAYEAIDDCEFTSDILKVLQDDGDLEVVLDATGRGNGLLSPPAPVAGGNYLLCVGPREADVINFSEVVGDLVHGMTHRVMMLLYDNDALPYEKGDAERKKEYDGIVSVMMSATTNVEISETFQMLRKCDQGNYGALFIASVPEMMCRYRLQKDTENAEKLLEREVPELFNFYRKYVMATMKSYVKRKRDSYKIPVPDMKLFPQMLCKHKSDDIELDKRIADAVIFRHNGVGVFSVTCVKLAVSHLVMALRKVFFVDWEKYEQYKNVVEDWLKWNVFENAVVILDGGMGSEICGNPDRCINTCPARRFESLGQKITVVIPKSVRVPVGITTMVYSWALLSEDTRNRILGKGIIFQGKETTLRDILERSLKKKVVLRTIAKILKPEDIPELLDRQTWKIGRQLDSEEKIKILLRGNNTNHIARREKVRRVDWGRETFERRSGDVFIIRGATLKDLSDEGVGVVRTWDGRGLPRLSHCRCFLLPSKWNAENDMNTFKKMAEEFKPRHGMRKWEYAHIYDHRNNKYEHVLTVEMEKGRARILSGPPGCGKTVHVYWEAAELKAIHPRKWVEVIELKDKQEHLERWSEKISESIWSVQDLLFELIRDKKGESSSLEKMVFQLFCGTMGQIYIFVDGFDEVCPCYRNKVTAFLQELLLRTEVEFCVTTREHECTHLEQSLQILSATLVPFSGREQVAYLSSEWEESLRSLSPEEREVKVGRIVSAVEWGDDENGGRWGGMPKDAVWGLTSRRSSRDGSEGAGVDFTRLAEGVRDFHASVSRGEDRFSGNPLQAWMMSSVCFERDFRFKDSVDLFVFHRRFFERKLEIYIREKVMIPDNYQGNIIAPSGRCCAYDLLKKFSAFAFLGREKQKLNEDLVEALLPVGILTRNEDVSFVHRSFGEYLLSIWLLENVKSSDVTLEFLSRVSLEDEFQRVRKILDGLVLWAHDKEISSSGENGLEIKIDKLNTASFSCEEELTAMIQKCISKFNEEGDFAVLEYIRDCCGDYLNKTVFDNANWDTKTDG